MLDILSRYSAGIVLLIVLSLFILNSALKIKDTRKELDKKDFLGFQRTHVIYVLFGHSLIILWMIKLIIIFLYKVFVS